LCDRGVGDQITLRGRRFLPSTKSSSGPYSITDRSTLSTKLEAKEHCARDLTEVDDTGVI